MRWLKQVSLSLSFAVVAGAAIAGTTLSAQEAAKETPSSGGPEMPAPDKSQGPELSKEEAAPAEPESAPKLSKEMAAFRDRIRRTLGRYYEQPLNTNVNTASDVILFCLAFGCEAELRHGAGKINGIGCLCWNYPCGGYRVLRAGNDGIVPRVGYGLQDQPSQLLAVLGQTAVPETYELRVGQQRGTVVDLVNHEKLTCRSGTDQSLKLVGLACYLRDDESWKNESGEEWSLERLLQEELDRSVALDDSAATNRLLGLTYALRRRARSQRPRDGQYARAEAFLDEFHRHALSLQNSDGSWHPRFFASRGESRDTIESLRSTGHILHWLTISLPDSRLQTAEILRAVNYLDNQLAGLVARWNTTSATPRKMDAVAHALGALTTYDQRVFQPYDTRPQTTNSAAAAEKN